MEACKSFLVSGGSRGRAGAVRAVGVVGAEGFGHALEAGTSEWRRRQ